MSQVTDVISDLDSQGVPHRRAAGGRPPQKRAQIERFIRARIISGRWKPGQQLPTQIQLREIIDASNQSMLEAIDRLVEQGFIRTEGRRGTFVCENPPHLNRFAMIFSATPESRTAGTFWRVMIDEAHRLNALDDPTTRIVPFFNINGHRDEPEYQRLILEIENQCLAGLLFASAPHDCKDDEKLAGSRLPRAAVMSSYVFPNTPIVTIDTVGFARRAGEFLLSRGKRNPAIIVPTHIYNPVSVGEVFEKPFIEALGKTGVDLRDWRIIALPHMATRSAAEVTRLLMRLNPSERPDSFIIADDSHIPGVAEGLAGLNLPRESLPLVLALCNHPAVLQVSIPITLLGYDVRTIVRHLIDQVRFQRLGLPFEPVMTCPPLFADEVSHFNALASV